MNRNTVDPREVRRQEQLDKGLAFRKRQDLRDALSRESTRRILFGVIEMCGVFDEIAPGTAESHAQLGMRRIGLALRRDILEMDSTALSLMEAEYRAPPEIPMAGVDGEDGGVEFEP